jgi:hypothetical protein
LLFAMIALTRQSFDGLEQLDALFNAFRCSAGNIAFKRDMQSQSGTRASTALEILFLRRRHL